MKKLDHLSDEALVAQAGRGDETALGALYDRHGRSAYALALRVLRDAHLAEDAVQEAFLDVWRGAVKYRPDRARPSSWILMLVHRRAVDRVRKEERRRADSLDVPGHGYEPVSPAAEQEAWRELEAERTRQALTSLPDQQREMIELAFFDGFTQSELASRLGIPLGTVKSRMFHGLANLRERLREPEEDYVTVS